MEKLHLEILDQERENIFQKLSTFRSLGYLSGGTALALQLGHRVSYDFDIFCAKEIPASFPAKIKKEMRVKEVLVNNADEFTFITEYDIKISFIFYPFDLEKYVLEFPDAPLRIISSLGVALTKAYAMNRRNAWRDYVDLYVILKKRITKLEDIVQKSSEAYGELFNEKLFLAQLLYTQDISNTEIDGTQMIEPATLAEVADFFEKEIDAYLKRKL
ncbi:MAG: nucleotidyl transferase AbiEii/AbiGii toxin family protein [Parcubacteria group bacterium]